MNAYRIYSSAESNNTAKAKCAGNLPAVFCEVCGANWFATSVWYPTVRMIDETKKALYSNERTVSLKELQNLRNGLIPKTKADKMAPGAGIGPIEACLSPYATDFVSAGRHLIAAKPVIRKFEDHGLIIPHGPATVYLGKTRSEAYVALELNFCSLCSERTESAFQIGRCDECGSVKRLGGFDLALINSIVREYVTKKVPDGQGLVIEDVDEMTLATEAFIKIYRENRMTGLAFEKAGLWISGSI